MQIKNHSTLIQTQIDTLTNDQLDLFYCVYHQLNLQFNFFMSEDTYQKFINFSYNCAFSKNNINTYKSLIKLLTTSYTLPSKYPHVIESINLIKNNYSAKDIINIIYHYEH